MTSPTRHPCEWCQEYEHESCRICATEAVTAALRELRAKVGRVMQFDCGYGDTIARAAVLTLIDEALP